jgi:hypothetical protein
VSETIEVESIRRLDVKPGETLCVKLPGGPSEAEMDRLRALLTDNLPEGVKVLFFGSGVEVFVVNDAMAEAACSSPSS